MLATHVPERAGVSIRAAYRPVPFSSPALTFPFTPAALHACQESVMFLAELLLPL